jgi:probable rRNA maturation factor
MGTKIDLNIENETSQKVDPDKIKSAIDSVLKEKNLEGEFEVDVKIVSIQEIHTLNREYREIDKPTDVLSFPIYEKVDVTTSRPVLLGDIVLCPEMAEVDIYELIKHSTLHLLGYHHDGD